MLSLEQLSVRLPLQAGYIYPVSDMILSVRPGETLCLVGESGSGKSVSMQSILGLIEHVEFKANAKVTCHGHALLDLPERAMQKIRGRRIAMVFQEPMTALNPVMTVGEQIGEVLNLRNHLDTATVREQTIALLASVGINDAVERVDAYPHELSGGMKQRVVIAMALAGDPDILIADEPTTALDVTIQAQVLSVIQHLQQARNMGLILITHDLAIVAHMADKVAVMYAGEIVEYADKKGFFAAPKHPYSQQLLACLPDLSLRHQALATIPGRLPVLIEDFKACRFAPRCPHVYARCREEAPGLTEEGGTFLRCHLYTEPQAQHPSAVYGAPVNGASKALGGTVLTVRDLKTYFRVKTPYFWRKPQYLKAVDGVDLTLAEGETLAIVGESGCGKTTLAKSLMCLVKETQGEIVLGGTSMLPLQGDALKTLRRDIQMVFQDPFSSLNPRMLIRDIISEGWAAQDMYRDPHEREAKLVTLLSQVGLSGDILDRYPHEFSGGQRQRIAIARALAMDPRVLVCDEPTSALDVSVQAQIINLLKEIQRELGISYIMISHNLSVVSYMADRIAVMYLGRIVEQGPVHEIMTNPRHPYTQSLLASVPTLQNWDSPFKLMVGEPPSPVHPPTGCHFHPRCPHVMPRCKVEYPSDFLPAPGLKVSCFLYDTERE